MIKSILLEKMWEHYLISWLPKSLTEEQHWKYKQTFYAGLDGAMHLLFGPDSPDSFEEMQELVDKVRYGMARFNAERMSQEEDAEGFTVIELDSPEAMGKIIAALEEATGESIEMHDIGKKNETDIH